jgi:glutathione S-transferase
MKLYSMNLSPFAARARMAIYAKGLDVEIQPPAGGDTKSAEFLAINPFGKIPCLDTGEAQIPESETILEYIEDKFPNPPLRGAAPEETARMRLIARAMELYVGPHMQVLFGQLNPATRDAAKAEEALAKTEEGLDHLERLLSDGGYAVNDRLSLADCSIAPMTFFLPMIGGALGRDLTANRPKLKAYMAKLQGDPVWAKVQGEMMVGLQHMQSTGRPS